MAQPTREHFADRIIIDPNRRHGELPNLRNVAENGAALVGQIREVLDSGNLSSLVINVELLEATWIHQFTIENPSDSSRSKEETTEVGMTVTEGKEVATSVSASAGFSGWGFSAEVSGSTERRSFSSVETSEMKRVTDTYHVPPKSNLWVYKRGYKFRCTSWIYLEANNAWAEVNGNKVQARFVNTIIANHELMSPVELKGTGTISANTDGLLMPSKGAGLSALQYVVYSSMYPWIGNR
jgi:hypothetical protein